MKLKNINFKIVKNITLKKHQEKQILNLYHKLFTTIYGYDFYDAYLEVIKSKNYLKPKKDVLEVSPNSSKLKEVLDQIQNDSNIWVIEVFNKHKLMGLGRIELTKDSVRLKELVLKVKNKDKIKLILEKSLNFLMSYYEGDYATMSVEVPFRDVKLLLLLDRLGFKEDADKIELDDITYLLSKSLEVSNE